MTHRKLPPQPKCFKRRSIDDILEYLSIKKYDGHLIASAVIFKKSLAARCGYVTLLDESYFTSSSIAQKINDEDFEYTGYKNDWLTEAYNELAGSLSGDRSGLYWIAYDCAHVCDVPDILSLQRYYGAYCADAYLKRNYLDKNDIRQDRVRSLDYCIKKNEALISSVLKFLPKSKRHSNRNAVEMEL